LTGVAGTSGTSGGGGGSIAIYDEGTLVTSSAVSLNFAGTCITAVDDGGGAITVGIDCSKIYVIASTSATIGDFQVNESLDNYRIGDSACGWNGCEWTVLSPIVSGVGTPFPTQNGSCAIPNLYDTSVPPFKINLCGHVFCDTAVGADQVGVSVSWVKCSELSQIGVSQPTIIFEDVYNYNPNTKSVCIGSQVTYYDPISQCDGMFIVGISSRLATPNKVRFTWTLSILY
jgi:hypothetical protein